MTDRKASKAFLLAIFIFLFSSLEVKADSGSFTLGLSCPANAEIGQTISVSVIVKNMTEPIGGVGATLNYDSSTLQLIDKVSGNAMAINYNNANPMKFMGISMGGGLNSYSTLVTYKFKTLKSGSTSLSFYDATSTNTSYSNMTVYKETYSLTINEPLSANNDLSSLSVSGTNISLSNLNASVSKDVSNITISAAPKDNTSTISGTGTKSLNYGKNTFTISVKAQNGAVKNYTISINREDPRSKNSNLSSLKVSSGTLNPKFNSSTTTYTMTVPYDVSKIDVKAIAEDSKAKVTVSGNNNLPAESTTDVVVKSTSESGEVKTYTIKVTREKDPNKPKSTNNYLASITPSVGILSPAFNKDKTNYVIYLPYEIDKIDIDAKLEDSSLAKMEANNPSNLNVGVNHFEYKVTAEDGGIKTYVINVIRGASVDGESSSIKLKDIEISGGKLTSKFKSDVMVYKYKKDNNFKVTPIPEDSNTKVSVYENEGVYTILLESNENVGIYSLIPEDSSNIISNNSTNSKGVIITIIIFIPLVIASSIIGYIIGKKNLIKKRKKKI